ncbi:efflux RND transporter periplasmic adaptor subunit [Alkalicaulis satelles]|uniref:Efflux RND transporter periplasmic adaptor subunit n=1 Tax=Alkalicaulis satelles TaxID=2609175 RepID=A0A5M6ZBV8_9PROT|nr:efflux RND transporter periplasmic adaptor subunit [Alkalicaulis satelles]KAA5802202.1 efflux RND transporter periplasmic adaptor subunit [Alkalicaulis satelles]
MSAGQAPQSGSGQSLIGWLQIGAVGALVLAALITTFVLMDSGDTGAPATEARTAVPVRVITPERASHTVNVSLTGTVTASAFIDLAPQVGGQVTSVSPAVRAGGSFSADEVLFEIDRRDFEIAETRARAAVAEARSALNQLEAEADIARREWERTFPDREITPLAAREPQLEAARARLLAGEAELAQARLNLERTRVRYAFDGAVTESRIEAGLLVSSGQSYGQVFALDRVELVAPAAASEIVRLDGAVGRAARIRIEGAEDDLSGQVARAGARLDPRTRFIDLFITLDEAPQDLRPGLFANIVVEGPALEDVMRLPASAVTGLDTIYRVRDGVIERASITVRGRERGGVLAEPFDPGEGVIVSPVPDIMVGRRADILSENGGRP